MQCHLQLQQPTSMTWNLSVSQHPCNSLAKQSYMSAKVRFSQQYLQRTARQLGLDPKQIWITHVFSLCMRLPPGYSIVEAESDADFQVFSKLALDYSRWLGVDLCFQVCLTSQYCSCSKSYTSFVTPWALISPSVPLLQIKIETDVIIPTSSAVDAHICVCKAI